MNIRFGLRAWTVALALAAIPAAALAAVDSFIWFDGVPGTSKDPSHQGAIEITSFSFADKNPTTIGSATGGAGAGKAKFNEFTITKTVDSASPLLMRAATTGQHFAQVKLEMRKAGGDPKQLMTYTFKNVMVTSVHSGGSGGDRPVESISFAFDSYAVDYSNATTGQSSTAHAGWN